MPRTSYPRTNTGGLVNGQTAEALDVLNAIIPLDKAIEDMRTGWLEMAQTRFDLGATLTISGGAITITNTYHLITTVAWQGLTTINGANQGDILILERAGGSADIKIGNWVLSAVGQAALIHYGALGITVLACSGQLYAPSAKAYRATSVQAIAASTATKVQFNASAYSSALASFRRPDTNADPFDAVTNFRFQPVFPSIYQIDVQILWATAIPNGTYTFIYLLKNGVAIAEKRQRGNGNVDLTVNMSVQDLSTSTSDYYEVYVQQNDVGSHNVQFGATFTWATFTRLHQNY